MKFSSLSQNLPHSRRKESVRMSCALRSISTMLDFPTHELGHTHTCYEAYMLLSNIAQRLPRSHIPIHQLHWTFSHATGTKGKREGVVYIHVDKDCESVPDNLFIDNISLLIKIKLWEHWPWLSMTVYGMTKRMWWIINHHASLLMTWTHAKSPSEKKFYSGHFKMSWHFELGLVIHSPHSWSTFGFFQWIQIHICYSRIKNNCFNFMIVHNHNACISHTFYFCEFLNVIWSEISQIFEKPKQKMAVNHDFLGNHLKCCKSRYTSKSLHCN